MKKQKLPEDLIDISLCKTALGKIIFILKSLIGGEVQNLSIEVPRAFLINTSEYVQNQLIGKSIKIHFTNNDNEVKLENILLRISHNSSNYEKLYHEKLFKDLRDFESDVLEFNITIQDKTIVSKIIENIQIYNLNVKTI